MWIDWSLFQFPCRFESTLVVKIWLTGGEFDSATFRFNNWNCWAQTGPSRHATLAHYICTLKTCRLLNWLWTSVIHLLLVSLFPPAVVSVVFLIVAHPLGFVFLCTRNFIFRFDCWLLTTHIISVDWRSSCALAGSANHRRRCCPLPISWTRGCWFQTIALTPRHTHARSFIFTESQSVETRHTVCYCLSLEIIGKLNSIC